MQNLFSTAKLDIAESLRARWFLIYSLVFGGFIVALLLSGLAESRVMGFTGLSRLMLIYIQLCMAILPIFILLTTVRSVAGDRDAGSYEYLLSLPVTLSDWFWGKFLGRFVVIFLPVFLSMLLAIVWALVSGYEVPWLYFFCYSIFLVCLAICFLGIGMMISAMTRSPDLAQGIAFAIWLVLLLFIDLILIGLMISEKFMPGVIVAIALENPLQAFRTASLLLFDPQLISIGPAAYLILDHIGRANFFLYATLYPVLLGVIAATFGYRSFRRSDLI